MSPHTSLPSLSSSTSGAEVQSLPLHTSELGQLPAHPMEFFSNIQDKTSFDDDLLGGWASYAHEQHPMPTANEVTVETLNPTLFSPPRTTSSSSLQFANGVPSTSSLLVPEEIQAFDPPMHAAHLLLDNTASPWANLPFQYDGPDDWTSYLTNLWDYTQAPMTNGNRPGEPFPGSS